MQTEEGQAMRNSGTGVYKYRYLLKDHLGNTRVTMDDNNGTPDVVQEDEYYAFGLNAPRTIASPQNDYLYNGKEKQDVLAEQYDYGARFYDPVIGRWTSVDPSSENYESHSTYAYVGNNPILRIDKDGRDWDVIINNETHTITIRADFSAVGGNGSSVDKATNMWNSQSGKFNYVVGKGKDAISYAINFDLSTNSDREAAENSVQVLPDSHKLFAERKDVDGETTIKPQGVSDGKNFAMKDSKKDDTKKIAHEIGHNLGMNHKSGVMDTEASGSKLKIGNVIEMLGFSGVGKGEKGAKTEAKVKQRIVIGGLPEGFQNGKVNENKNHKDVKFQ